MPILEVTTRSGDRCSVEAAEGATLKQALMDGGVSEILALTSCGGYCSCGTCHVFVDEMSFSRLPPVKADEDALLDFHDSRTPFSRLSCQVKITKELHGMHVTIAPVL
ncbi:MAG: 2Fe-2S iron-sulfur cluster binding domain-containing protein [Hyphomonadaceae bacterium]|nr:2Fe-2S iron-sulfur cluster binding domain-containing protein [Hyphomonadaceae bacterium]